MSAVNEEMIPRRHPDAVFRNVDDQAVVVLPGVGEVQVLNAVGGRIWDLIDGSRSAADIAGAIAGEFEVTEANARTDTVEFLQRLHDHGMLST